MCCILPVDYRLHKVPAEGLPPSAEAPQKRKAPAHRRRAHADAAFPPAAEEGQAARPKQQYTSAFKPVERRDGSQLSFEEFRREFEKPNTPVVLTHVATEWPFFKILNEKFCNLSAEKRLLVKDATVLDAPLRCEYTNMNLDEYVQYAMTQKDERPIYMFDAEFGNLLDIDRLYTVPDFFARDDFFSVMGAERPKYRWIIAGPQRGGSSFHVDPNYTNAWNANLTGRKRWLLFPPGATPPGVVPSENMAEVATPVSLSEWLLNNYDATVQQFRRLGYECICEPGDIMFVPSGWWHSVINLEDSVAITQNYVSESNLSNVVKFLRYMKGSISGINEDADDATEEGTKRRQVGFAEQFITAMERKHPALMASVEERLQEEHREREKRRPMALPLLEKDSEGFHFDF
ncbi:transferase, transferring glycosyl group [Strigomonas culicis]|uniref:Transferase, transferring glycosyl group n=1 Tax=Strigomonas culicis TaxID=28005 RepID=S9UF62_9TRYP|nr:transferase, transferring glycosyl group [Strigomonas culicis]|eukprot:EPY29452.1 transferase, transferring glycosyl group [Strigomonas culicis]